MRIGVDATCWSNQRGYGRFARALLSNLLRIDHKNSYVFFEDSADRAAELPAGVESVTVATGRPATRAAAANGRRSLRDLWRMTRAVSRHPLDLFFFPSVYTYYPILNRIPKLVTIHDTIPELFPQLVFPTRASRYSWKAKVTLGRWQAATIVTVSEHSRQCLVRYLGVPFSRIRVVGEASDAVFRPLDKSSNLAQLQRHGLTPGLPFLLYVGGFSPHKNLNLLVEAFRHLGKRPPWGALRLVLAGDYAGDVFFSCYQALRAQIEESGLADRVIFTGHVPDADLVVLLNHAQMLVLPSKLEGFGLPAVEAAACGTPVVATTAGPLPQLLGEGGVYVPPNDRAALEKALAEVLGDSELRRRMGRAGLEAARRLTWENSARQLLSVFSEAAGSANGQAA